MKSNRANTYGFTAVIATLALALLGALLFLFAVHGSGASAAGPDPDLSLTKSDSPDPVSAGSELTYTISVTNNDPTNSATNTTVTDDLPKELTFNSAVASIGTCDHKGGKVTCDLGTLAAGQSATITVKATVKQNTKAGQISNTASVTSSGPDANTANNSDTEVTTVLNAAGPGVTCFGKKVTIAGTPGSDVLTGTPGNDVIRGFAGNDTVLGDDGKDLICTNGGADTVNAGARDDRVKGGIGADLIKGRAGNDELRGNRGRDRLRGNAGNDLLAGGRGFDRCRGGSGSDTLVSCEGH